MGVLGDLSVAAQRYAQLWGEVQATLETTERIRLRILEQLLVERNSNADAARLSDAYGSVRDETGIRPFAGAREILEGPAGGTP